MRSKSVGHTEDSHTVGALNLSAIHTEAESGSRCGGDGEVDSSVGGVNEGSAQVREQVNLVTLLLHINEDVGVAGILSLLTAIGIAEHECEFLNLLILSHSIVCTDVTDIEFPEVGRHIFQLVLGIIIAPARSVLPVGIVSTQVCNHTRMGIDPLRSRGALQTLVTQIRMEINYDILAALLQGRGVGCHDIGRPRTEYARKGHKH